jgi:hypothetical protein
MLNEVNNAIDNDGDNNQRQYREGYPTATHSTTELAIAAGVAPKGLEARRLPLKHTLQ